MIATRKVLIVMSIAIALMLFFAVLPTPKTGASATTDNETTAFVIHNVHVFDGESLQHNRRVRVADGRIQSIDPDEGPLPDTSTVDGGGGYLLPGLIDSHVHIFDDGLSDALRYGVTSVIDLFTHTAQLDPAEANRTDINYAEGADMWSAGTLVTVPGGHGTQFGLDIPTLSDPAGAQTFVEERVREGSDFIKLVIESGEAHDMDFPTLSPTAVEAVVDAAHDHDRLAIAHAGSREEARTAVDTGVDGLAHVFADAPMEEGLLGDLADGGVFVIPTVTVIDGPFAEQNTAALAEAGVQILAGSDAPNAGLAHGAGLHQELENLVAAGLSPRQALTAATATPADVLGLPERGRIVPGYRADLFLVAGNPLETIGNTRNIERIWKNGVPVEKATEAGKANPSPAVTVDGESDLISNFESGHGGAWQANSDEFMNGNSTAQIGEGPPGVLRVEGEIRPGFNWPFAGVVWWPGDRPMTPTDLSDYDGIRIRIRGNQDNLRLMVFTGSGRGRPAQTRLAISPEWDEITVPFDDLQDVDTTEVSGIGIYAGPDEGPFEFDLDAAWLVGKGGSNGE